MAGTFTHLSLVHCLCTDEGQLSRLEKVNAAAAHSLRTHSHIALLGAIGPDCPYLVRLTRSREANSWGDVMHYWKTADFIRTGIRHFSGKDLDSPLRRVQLAWLFGYASHAIIDLTFHPVVERTIAEYPALRRRHLHCELNQDAFLFHKHDPADGEFLSGAILRQCGMENTDRLHDAVTTVWWKCAYAARYGGPYPKPYPRRSPAPANWFRWLLVFMDKGAAEDSPFPFTAAELLGRGKGYLQKPNDVDAAFIDGLKTPSGKLISFTSLFDLARRNVRQYWEMLARAIVENDPERFTLPNANLDTGLADSDGHSIFWSEDPLSIREPRD